MSRNAIVVSVDRFLEEDEISSLKEQVREQLRIPDSQEVYIVGSYNSISISSVQINEEDE